jgi:hypothetical protein
MAFVGRFRSSNARAFVDGLDPLIVDAGQAIRMSPERWAINRDSVLDAAWCAALGGCITANSEEELAKRASDESRSTIARLCGKSLLMNCSPAVCQRSGRDTAGQHSRFRNNRCKT